MEFKTILDQENSKNYNIKGIHWGSGQYGAWIRVQLTSKYTASTPDILMLDRDAKKVMLKKYKKKKLEKYKSTLKEFNK